MNKTTLRSTLLLLVIAALTCVLITAACGTGGEDVVTPSPTPPPDPSVIIQAAADRFEALQFFTFTMTHENGGTPIAFGLLMEDVTGQVVAPDRLKADIGAWAGGFFFDVSLIAIGEETWLTNPFIDEFELIERGIVSSALLDPATGISGIIRDAKDPVLEGETSLDGISTYHISSTIDSGQLTSISPIAESGYPILVGIWVGLDDSLVYKIRLEGRLSAEEEPDIIRTILPSDFDIPAEIAPPPLGSNS